MSADLLMSRSPVEVCCVVVSIIRSKKSPWIILIVGGSDGIPSPKYSKEEVEEWNLMGWYQGKNPQRRSRPLSISDLSPEMLKSMVESSDYHCQGCILGPVMVKIDGWKPNRMTATSSGSNSKHKNMQHPTKKKPKSQPPVYRKPGSKRPVQKQSDLKLRRDL